MSRSLLALMRRMMWQSISWQFFLGDGTSLRFISVAWRGKRSRCYDGRLCSTGTATLGVAVCGLQEQRLRNRISVGVEQQGRARLCRSSHLRHNVDVGNSCNRHVFKRRCSGRFCVKATALSTYKQHSYRFAASKGSGTTSPPATSVEKRKCNAILRRTLEHQRHALLYRSIQLRHTLRRAHSDREPQHSGVFLCWFLCCCRHGGHLRDDDASHRAQQILGHFQRHRRCPSLQSWPSLEGLSENRAPTIPIPASPGSTSPSMTRCSRPSSLSNRSHSRSDVHESRSRSACRF